MCVFRFALLRLRVSRYQYCADPKSVTEPETAEYYKRQ